MSARRFFNSIIKKTSRSGKNSPSMTKANASTTEDETDEDKEVVDPRKGITLSAPKSPGGRRAVSAIGLQNSVKQESHPAARRVKSMPRPRGGKETAVPVQQLDALATGHDEDSSPEVTAKRRIKPRRTLPPGAPQARIRLDREAQDDYTDPEDATGVSAVGQQENANATDDEYTEPWQKDGMRAKKVMNRTRSPTPENVVNRPNSTYDEPWDQKRKHAVVPSVKTEAQPTPSSSTGMKDGAGNSDYADPWDRLPKSGYPHRVKSSKSPDLRRKAMQAAQADQDDYDQPWDRKRLNDQGVVVGGKKSQSQSKSSDDYDDPWDTHATKPPVLSLKPPKPKPKPTPRSTGSDDYDDPWDKMTSSVGSKSALSARSDPWDKLTASVGSKSALSPRPDPWDKLTSSVGSKAALFGRPAPPTRPIPPRPLDRATSPEDEKPKWNERAVRRLDRRATEENPGPVPAIIDTGLPLVKQTWFHGTISRAEADKILRVAVDSSFLVRVSESNKDDHSLSIRRSGDIVHLKIARKHEKFVLGLHGKPHATIPDLIKHYTEHKVPIKGLESFVLLYPVRRN